MAMRKASGNIERVEPSHNTGISKVRVPNLAVIFWGRRQVSQKSQQTTFQSLLGSLRCALFTMPRAKNAKVWNEDLVTAFQARAQQALSQGKSSHLTWRTAAQSIEAVRTDIYQASTGR